METRTNLVAFELIGGVLGWIWIIASIGAVVFVVMAIFSDSPWSRFFLGRRH